MLGDLLRNSFVFMELTSLGLATGIAQVAGTGCGSSMEVVDRRARLGRESE
jgi:hypothetical protein